MALTSTKFLRTDGLVFLRDQQHASKLFAAEQFRLAPKFSHLFHVSFSINPEALKVVDIYQRHKNEINMLVKSVSLPKFTVSVETANQYNRKKNIQYQHKFSEVKVVFHDDNMGLINQLWQNYYAYYYADSLSATKPGAFNRNATRNSNFITAPYGLDNGSTIPFFNYIKIYHMAKHEYVCYQLHNPMISSWDHKSVDYSGKDTHTNEMSVFYEAVSYSSGEVSTENVEGFGLEHYDVTPSPLTGLPTPSTSPSFVSQQNVQNNFVESLNNTVKAINTYQNVKERQQEGIPGLLSLSPSQTLGGVPGITFPQSDNIPDTGITVAKKINL